MIESGPMNRFKPLEQLELRALKYIDNILHVRQGDDILYTVYDMQPLSLRWREHIGCIMYSPNRDINNVDLCNPRIN